ncbi:MAG: DNA N-6-adenine-methyltransferase [Polyangiaceae bacterium]
MRQAALNRHRSKQDYETPFEFIHAVEELIGAPFAWDLAARADNTKASLFIPPEMNSLTVDWCERLDGRWGWLNPPFGNIRPWAEKCEIERAGGAKVALLVPASVGSKWFADHVWGSSKVRPVRPRICFDGQNPYPKDLMLCLYGLKPGFEPWEWK